MSPRRSAASSWRRPRSCAKNSRGRRRPRRSTRVSDVATLVEEATDLLQHLIRNECVNDGTPASGHEIRSVETLVSYLQTPGVEIKRYEPQRGRGSMVLRIEGSDPKAPSLH